MRLIEDLEAQQRRAVILETRRDLRPDRRLPRELRFKIRLVVEPRFVVSIDDSHEALGDGPAHNLGNPLHPFVIHLVRRRGCGVVIPLHGDAHVREPARLVLLEEALLCLWGPCTLVWSFQGISKIDAHPHALDHGICRLAQPRRYRRGRRRWRGRWRSGRATAVPAAGSVAGGITRGRFGPGAHTCARGTVLDGKCLVAEEGIEWQCADASCEQQDCKRAAESFHIRPDRRCCARANGG